MPNTQDLYHEYKTQMQRLADVRFSAALLQWDQETYMPQKGAHFRGQQISTLTEIAHNIFTGEGLGNLLQELLAKEDLAPDEKANVALSWEDYSRQKKYSADFVRRLSEQTNKTFHAWIEARRKVDFSLYQKDLDALVQLKKEETDLLGFESHPYNALLHEFEKGCTVALLDKIFSGLLPQLQELLNAIAARPQVDDSFLQQHYPKDEQWKWSLWLVAQLGYDLEAGRQDISEHPFSVSFSAQDVRITTRIDEADFANATWSTIHEVGHALYEQGLPQTGYGLPAGEACSYSMHESQSRLWENSVGRGSAFWKYYFPKLQQHFPQQFGSVNEEIFYKGINKVQPSLIRTEADELTYHFHVYIRYELEKNLIEGSLQTADIPAYWNEQYKALLGVTVPDDKQGCLQDVHWSHGSFGYFPTYSLGSFYAAQIFATAQKALPALNDELVAGRTQSLLGWLRSNVHQKGRLLTSEQLCAEVTGQPLDVRFFIAYILEKYKAIYNL